MAEIVAAMRRLGVKSYKGSDFEIVLTDDAPVATSEKSVAEPPPTDAERRLMSRERHHNTLFAATSIRPRMW
jgi:hypothetical protein